MYTYPSTYIYKCNMHAGCCIQYEFNEFNEWIQYSTHTLSRTRARALPIPIHPPPLLSTSLFLFLSSLFPPLHCLHPHLCSLTFYISLSSSLALACTHSSSTQNPSQTPHKHACANFDTLHTQERVCMRVCVDKQISVRSVRGCLPLNTQIHISNTHAQVHVFVHALLYP